MITKSLLSKIIKTGNLTWVMPNGEINTYGDGTGDPIKIRTTNNFSEIKLLMNPSIHFGESYMNGSLVVEEGRIHDFLKLIFANTEVDIDHWVMKLSKIVRAISNKLTTSNYISKSKRNVAHHYDLSDNFLNDMKHWIENDKMKWKETIDVGIESAPNAFLKLFKGENFGKMLVKIAEE